MHVSTDLALVPYPPFAPRPYVQKAEGMGFEPMRPSRACRFSSWKDGLPEAVAVYHYMPQTLIKRCGHLSQSNAL